MLKFPLFQPFRFLISEHPLSGHIFPRPLTEGDASLCPRLPRLSLSGSRISRRRRDSNGCHGSRTGTRTNYGRASVTYQEPTPRRPLGWDLDADGRECECQYLGLTPLLLRFSRVTSGVFLPKLPELHCGYFLLSELLFEPLLLELSVSELLLPELLSLLVPELPWSEVELLNEPEPVPPTPVSACTP
jgi:hypothetical protein